MNKVIEAYYAQAKINPFIIRQKLAKFSRNSDIQAEFVHWIENKEYRQDAVVIQGYTAKMLAALSEYLNGEGAFILMIELREDPEKAMSRISHGFNMK